MCQISPWFSRSCILQLHSFPFKMHRTVLKGSQSSLSTFGLGRMNQPIQHKFNSSIGKSNVVLMEELLHISVSLSELFYCALKAFYGKDEAEERQAKSENKNKRSKVRTKNYRQLKKHLTVFSIHETEDCYISFIALSWK